MKTNVSNDSLEPGVGASSPDFWIHAESIAERSRRHPWEIKQHRHEHFSQFLHVRRGSGDAHVGHEICLAEAGSIVFIPEKITHGFRFPQDTDGQVFTILTERLLRHASDRLRTFLSRPRLFALIADDADSDYLTETLDRVEDELSVGFGARYGLIESYMGIALEVASGLHLRQDGDDGTTGKDGARIRRLNGLIASHYREHLPIEFYARELGVSVTHLNRITKAQTGRTMNELLSDKIIAQAKRDLVFTFQTAQEIAHALGFSDPAYFTRFFSRESGETPRQFRERERSQQSRIGMAAE